MKYLCMVLVDEKKLEALSASELQTLDDESLAYDDSLRKRGHLIAAQALESVQTATIVRVRNGKVSVNRWAFRRNQRADRRLPSDRGAGSEPGHPTGRAGSRYPARRHRSAPHQGIDRELTPRRRINVPTMFVIDCPGGLRHWFYRNCRHTGGPNPGAYRQSGEPTTIRKEGEPSMNTNLIAHQSCFTRRMAGSPQAIARWGKASHPPA